eukprot:SM000180S03512  [mRNA]  locus=s180:259993:262654:- [translate_table: standard]
MAAPGGRAASDELTRGTQRRRQAGTLTMLAEAIKGARADLASRQLLSERLCLSVAIVLTIAKELLSMVLVVPYAVHAFRTYRALGTPASAQHDGVDTDGLRKSWWPTLSKNTVIYSNSIRVIADVPYGPKERNMLDIYVAPESSVAKPVALFIHGGVWASGERWQYAPLGACLAQAGVIGVLISYSLYPDVSSCCWRTFKLVSPGGLSAWRAEEVEIAAGRCYYRCTSLYKLHTWRAFRSLLNIRSRHLDCHSCAPVQKPFVAGESRALYQIWCCTVTVKSQHSIISSFHVLDMWWQALANEQVDDASQALSWTMDHISEYGGDPSRITLMGHSSGAHICAMLLWQRCSRRLAADRDAGAPSARASASASLDARQPNRFVGLSGVYNIAEHLMHERKRGVASISCMTPATGGEPNFAAMSPSLLFQSLAPPPPGPSSGPAPVDNVTGAAQTGCLMDQHRHHGGQSDEALHEVLNQRATLTTSLGSTNAGQQQQPAAEVSRARVLVDSLGSAPLETGAASPPPSTAGPAASTGHLVCPCFLLCSPGDIVVPPTTSRELGAALSRLGVPVKLIEYGAVSHGQFVCWNWRQRRALQHVEDILEIVLGEPT